MNNFYLRGLEASCLTYINFLFHGLIIKNFKKKFEFFRIVLPLNNKNAVKLLHGNFLCRKISAEAFN